MMISSFAFTLFFLPRCFASVLLSSSCSSKLAKAKGMTDQSPRRVNNSLKIARAWRRLASLTALFVGLLLPARAGIAPGNKDPATLHSLRLP